MEKKVEQYQMANSFLWFCLPDQMSSTAIALYMYLGNSLDLPQAIELLALFE